jgi:hypothetical protein
MLNRTRFHGMERHNIYLHLGSYQAQKCTPESTSPVGHATTQKRAGQHGIMAGEVQRHFGKFALENFDLVQKEDDRRAE